MKKTSARLKDFAARPGTPDRKLLESLAAEVEAIEKRIEVLETMYNQSAYEAKMARRNPRMLGTGEVT